MRRYAVIGWGSLIWDLENLAGLVEGGWRMGEGPLLPLEFSRVSPKRKLGLTLCLDPDHGADCQSHWILSRRRSVGGAAADLARRERAVAGRIGAVCVADGVAQGRLGPVVRLIRDWCLTAGLDGAVWTDLESNFSQHLGDPFSIDRAVAYLSGLSGDSRDEAVRYIENAPQTTVTPLRRRLAEEAWWREEAGRVRALAPARVPPLSKARRAPRGSSAPG
ncbi:MAG TPA: hypothetical protein VMM55_07645 [Thermohalobaculum sp.]|nr:hypothetical protein [Thermohalobaculum sp.]